MNKLVKPQKQSYSGDTQVLAYSDTCEMTWATAICPGPRPWFGLGGSPFLAAVGVTCLVFSIVCSAVRNAYI